MVFEGHTGQVMELTITADTPAGEGFTAPEDLQLSLADAGDPAADGQIRAGARDLALLEEESLNVCVTLRPNGKISQDTTATPDPLNPGTCIDKKGASIQSAQTLFPKQFNGGKTTDFSGCMNIQSGCVKKGNRSKTRLAFKQSLPAGFSPNSDRREYANTCNDNVPHHDQIILLCH